MSQPRRIQAGMVGLGMIFDETYKPMFLAARRDGLDSRRWGQVDLELVAATTRTGSRVERHRADFPALRGHTDLAAMLPEVDVVCVASPDDRHFEPAKAALVAGKHVLIEKPSVLDLEQLDVLHALALANGVLVKVVYHKLADPDHKRLRTLVADGVLSHVNNGYCSLLEPKQVSGSQFAEWLTGRNPGTYVAIHYVKLIDFTFGPDWRLKRIAATGQRGLAGPVGGPTWDSVQLQIVYEYPDGREAAFDLHTSWVTPDNFPGYVEQEVQFRFDNSVWNAHQRKRGVEMCVEGRTPNELKNTPNHHYNAAVLEPWGDRTQRGYGIEILRRFFEEVAYVEFGGPPADRDDRLRKMRGLSHNDLGADRNCVAVVQAMEAILERHAGGNPGAIVEVNGEAGGLVLVPRRGSHDVMYLNPV